MEIYTRSAKRARKGKIGGYNMNKAKYMELTDKHMRALIAILEKYDVKATDPERFIDQCGDIVCDICAEAMEAQAPKYRYEIGELTKTEMLLNDPTAPQHFYWNMIAGFTTLEDAEAYSASRKEYTKVFIDGIPTGLNE